MPTRRGSRPEPDYTARSRPPRGEYDSSVEAARRREQMIEVYRQARVCTRCPELAATRTQVVFGSGNADAELMFIGEAPGAEEDRQGLPFVGRSGQLLEKLLGEIGLTRKDVFIANTIKCRPPGNRDPKPDEIRNCNPYLVSQVELIRPSVIATLGNFATKLVLQTTEGITRLRGKARRQTFGSREVDVVPMFHPAAALRDPRRVEDMRADLAVVAGLIGTGVDA